MLDIIDEPLGGVFVLEQTKFNDDRGFLTVPFHAEKISQLTGIPFEISQTMYSRSRLGVLRGLHYQDNTKPVAKLISCIRGEVFDVIVDLRTRSKTFGKWIGMRLSEYDTFQIYAPIGTAHGFLSLSEQSDVFYYQQGAYSPEASCIMTWNDPDLAINWPAEDLIISARDRTQGISWQAYKANPMF